MATLRPDEIHERNVRVLVAGNSAGFNQAAVLAVRGGILRTEGMITHRFEIQDHETALSLKTVEAEDYIKGIFMPARA